MMIDTNEIFLRVRFMYETKLNPKSHGTWLYNVVGFGEYEELCVVYYSYKYQSYNET